MDRCLKQESLCQGWDTPGELLAKEHPSTCPEVLRTKRTTVALDQSWMVRPIADDTHDTHLDESVCGQDGRLLTAGHRSWSHGC